jgi:hypothetical protein
MRNPGSRQTATAYHEAGHAVISHFLGLPIGRVSIVRDADTLGRVLHRPVGEWFQPDVVMNDRTRLRIERGIVVLFAGVIAERKFTGRYNHVGAKGDYDQVVDLAHFVTGSDGEAALFQRWLREKAINRVERRGAVSPLRGTPRTNAHRPHRAVGLRAPETGPHKATPTRTQCSPNHPPGHPQRTYQRVRASRLMTALLDPTRDRVSVPDGQNYDLVIRVMDFPHT